MEVVYGKGLCYYYYYVHLQSSGINAEYGGSQFKHTNNFTSSHTLIIIMFHWVLLLSRQGKTRLTKWFHPYTPKEKARIIREVTTMVLSRAPKLCNFLEWKEHKIIFKRYASLYFVVAVDRDDNELITLEIIHHFVEILDRYFGNVCELDLIFNFHKAYYILDELLVAGELQETSKKTVLRIVAQQDALQENPSEAKVEL
eukprot:TRINITY_DN1877_c0_g1_i1.p1 TRINITY_DN1877_c0_g1~~TRINITY_DN1877_c0_g1_i1.p1  ORF type:complete len:200 (+),score=45.18 TRINITY_DN1877_c0_g1_i1:52-651(+)